MNFGFSYLVNEVSNFLAKPLSSGLLAKYALSVIVL